jgi:hypothetical protein
VGDEVLVERAAVGDARGEVVFGGVGHTGIIVVYHRATGMRVIIRPLTLSLSPDYGSTGLTAGRERGRCNWA